MLFFLRLREEQLVPRDRGAFRTKLDPGHPAADATGQVRLPNVNSLIESMPSQPSWARSAD